MYIYKYYTHYILIYNNIYILYTLVSLLSVVSMFETTIVWPCVSNMMRLASQINGHSKQIDGHTKAGP